MIRFSGPCFAGVDNRLMSLQLVQQWLTDAAMFTADGEVVQPSEVLYKKTVLVERGSFRPITNTTLDMLERAQEQFLQEPGVQGEQPVVLMEMTLHNLLAEGAVDHQDFLARVDILRALGKTVLISNYARYYKLVAYLARYTHKSIGIALGVPSLREIFDEKFYTDLEGGLLESLGRLFKSTIKFYVYPWRDPVTGKMTTAENLAVAPNLRHLYAHLVENRFVVSIQKHNVDYLPIFSRDVLARIQTYDRPGKQWSRPRLLRLSSGTSCSASGSRNRPPTGREHLDPGCWGSLGQPEHQPSGILTFWGRAGRRRKEAKPGKSVDLPEARFDFAIRRPRHGGSQKNFWKK